jgi:SAM-dependent methyltransferase
MFKAIGERLRAYANKDGRGYPDWAMRYGPIERRWRKVLQPDARIVEVGANEASFARYSRRKTICVDLDPAGLKRALSVQPVMCVAADITALPFRNGTVDAILSIDTLEHIAMNKRDAALSELLRILNSTGEGVLSFPSGDGAIRAESSIRERYEAATGQTFRWLEEHSIEGLPSAEHVCVALRQMSRARAVVSSKNANLRVWSWMWMVLLCGWPGRGNAFFQAIVRLTTPLLSRAHFGACYRAMIWIGAEK